MAYGEDAEAEITKLLLLGRCRFEPVSRLLEILLDAEPFCELVAKPRLRLGVATVRSETVPAGRFLEILVDAVPILEKASQHRCWRIALATFRIAVWPDIFATGEQEVAKLRLRLHVAD